MTTKLRSISWTFGEGELVISFIPESKTWTSNHRKLSPSFGTPTAKTAKRAAEYAIQNKIV